MRELDSALMARARVFVETSAAAMAEAGDILQAVEEGVMDSSGIAGGLRDVVRGAVRRESPGEITVFKSVGLALEDLVLARAAAEHAPGG
jgi:ornithine cyclodeaminase